MGFSDVVDRSGVVMVEGQYLCNTHWSKLSRQVGVVGVEECACSFYFGWVRLLERRTRPRNGSRLSWLAVGDVPAESCAQADLEAEVSLQSRLQPTLAMSPKGCLKLHFL